MEVFISEKDIEENEQRLFYEKLKKEELIDIILEFEDSDKKDAEIYEYQNSKIKKLQKENENLKEAINKLAEYEDTRLTPQEIIEMRDDATTLFKENKQLRKENEELKNQQIKLAVEKLEEVLDFIYSNKWTNIELCVDNSPLKIIRNELYTMIAELKGEEKYEN